MIFSQAHTGKLKALEDLISRNTFNRDCFTAIITVT